jgi:hypothetical protein
LIPQNIRDLRNRIKNNRRKAVISDKDITKNVDAPNTVKESPNYLLPEDVDAGKAELFKEYLEKSDAQEVSSNDDGSRKVFTIKRKSKKVDILDDETDNYDSEINFIKIFLSLVPILIMIGVGYIVVDTVQETVIQQQFNSTDNLNPISETDAVMISNTLSLMMPMMALIGIAFIILKVFTRFGRGGL